MKIAVKEYSQGISGMIKKQEDQLKKSSSRTNLCSNQKDIPSRKSFCHYYSKSESEDVV
jgi:hypothetical protein